MEGRTGPIVLALVMSGAVSSWLHAQEMSATPPPSAATQAAPTSIIELQPFRRVTSTHDGAATLVDLNPNINAWFVLDVAAAGGRRSYHLENPDPTGSRVSLDESGGLRLQTRDGSFSCPLWSTQGVEALEAARRSALPFVPLCQEKLYLRNTVAGTYTRLEGITNFLRDHVWGGDHIVNFVREQFYRDAFLEKGRDLSSAGQVSPETAQTGAPLEAALDAGARESIVPENLGLDVRGMERGLLLGAWYPVTGAPVIYVSVVRPGALAPSILSSFRDRVARLDAVESNAIDYLVGFDVEQLELRFALGTDHPRVDWSGRELPQMHDARLPGPDGIGSTTPLARTGMVSPANTARTVATFAGGFKREHGAFHYGALANRNHGSHYGFIEEGVVFSRLVPGLATLYALEDGSVGMKTWADSDAALLDRVRYARQNGVALIETVRPGAAGVPGPLVAQWGAGNWSGSADEQLRSLRAGVCLQQTPRRQFLIYGYFSTATPSAMARVFQAYQCQYAMHLDMNALEHTYLAVYTRQRGQLLVQHLIQGMAEVDRKGGEQWAPRFLGFPDDRDFFYVLRRAPAAAAEP
ncbi:MAG TPA: hypothetical protein VHB68_10490 [Steroidobacteraceae bacterium]|nr:hypothetical protein [Steroidobacteraceae bacterium]